MTMRDVQVCSVCALRNDLIASVELGGRKRKSFELALILSFVVGLDWHLDIHLGELRGVLAPPAIEVVWIKFLRH